jgi:hypothetical protein
VARPYVLTVTSGRQSREAVLNVGLTMAMLGQRVLLFDADGNLAGLDVMTGVAPRFRLGDVLRGEQDLDSVLVTLAPGLRLLPGSSGEPHYPLLQGEAQAALLNDLLHREERNDVVIIDTAAGLTPEIIRYGEEADSVLVVTTPEPTAVMDAYAMIKVLGITAPGQLVELVVNNVRSVREGEETTTKLRAAAAFLVVSCSVRASFLMMTMRERQSGGRNRWSAPTRARLPHSRCSPWPMHWCTAMSRVHSIVWWHYDKSRVPGRVAGLLCLRRAVWHARSASVRHHRTCVHRVYRRGDRPGGVADDGDEHAADIVTGCIGFKTLEQEGPVEAPGSTPPQAPAAAA